MGKYEPLTIDADALAVLDDEHDDVHVFRGREKAPWLAVLRRPTPAEAIAYKAMVAKPEQKATANSKLVAACCVFPKGEDFDRQLKRWPFFPDGLADSESFKEFVGIAVDETEK